MTILRERDSCSMVLYFTSLGIRASNPELVQHISVHCGLKRS